MKQNDRVESEETRRCGLSDVVADSRINGRFANANIPRLKTQLVDQICAASGGPCTYTGKDMVRPTRA